MNIKIVKKNPIATTLILSLMFVGVGLTRPVATLAATTPSLGDAASYGVLAKHLYRYVSRNHN